jgi:hypothetical protein
MNESEVSLHPWNGSELFPPSSVASDSPRLRWCREHGITVSDKSDADGPMFLAWIANRKGGKDCFFDTDPESACLALAADRGIKDWRQP